MVQTPALQAMVARLIIALMVVGAGFSLAMWASSTTVLAWLSTALTMTVALGVSGAWRDARLANLGGGRFHPVLEVISGHPVLRHLVTDRAVRWAAAALAGIVVATAESTIAVTILGGPGWPAFAVSLVALALVAFPLWGAVGYLTYRAEDALEGFGARLVTALGGVFRWELPEPTRLRMALIGAVPRALGSLAARSLVLLLLPALADAPWALAFFGIVAVLAITAGDTLLAAVRAFRGGVPAAAAGDE